MSAEYERARFRVTHTAFKPEWYGALYGNAQCRLAFIDALGMYDMGGEL